MSGFTCPEPVEGTRRLTGGLKTAILFELRFGIRIGS